MRKTHGQPRRRIIVIGVVCIVFLFLLRGCFRSSDDTAYVFTVSRTATAADIEEKLATQDFLQDRWFFGLDLLLHGGVWNIEPGGYRINNAMSTWEISRVLTADPALKWVVIPEGLRKEQVADRLQTALGWDSAKRERFLTQSLPTPYDMTDGFYFPDTYLIPVDEDEEKVLKRFINRFNENFAPYVDGFREANIKYDTAIKIASLIQREAGGKSDKPLIAGVLWNRLEKKMRLEIDATLQYARGDTGSGYWAPIHVSAKKIDSPFNTYMYAGLPPQPIANPGIDSIDAVLHPTETACIFYLHDYDRQIHCSETYAEHLENIETYLRRN